MQERTGLLVSHRSALWRWLAAATAVFSLTAASAQAATTVYADTTTPLQAAAADPQVGSVMPGTPLTVLGTSGAQSHVQLAGWVIKGSETVLFEGVGLHAVLATFDASAKVPMKILKTQKDSYGTVWEQVEVTGYVSTKATAPKQADVWNQAANLYQTRCSACHALHDPTEFTANQWPGVLKAMGQNAALDQQQLNLITAYLQAHAKAQ
ncbi:MAG TPA: hypothetical protein VKA00_09265 [Trueperaceae bacterium]|nr:hypothetical protein [Trueperaceae bacterium]